MSGNAARLSAISTITSTPPVESGFDFASSPTSSVWGQNVFSLNEMEQRLPKAIFKSLKNTITSGKPLDIDTADAVAEAMKTWAISKGVTHYAHVFYPLTGLTAEKHDSFFDPDSNGGTIGTFAGKALIQGEPDGSSFPNGGIRQTFEARGYTIWDVTSAAYIIENPNGTTLCIPTAFVSWTGEALDKKTPVLRSMQALNKHAQRVLSFFGTDGPFVSSSAGAEQEYFLVDNNFFYARPDLLAAGRTLFGAPPPKGQEFDDHYFGAIPERVQAFMFEVERECFKLGIPAKTRHNEVAPGQFELAPVYEMANVATDHQQLVMTTLKKVAQKYGMTCLLHEKPFAGVNGSGKHVNFSMGSPKAGNLFDPGETPAENAQFLVFCAAMISAVYKHAKLLRNVVASASNDHRLGANEAPPAILSVFLGTELNQVMESIVNGSPVTSKKTPLNIGVDVLPQIPKDSGDRNRTSPMAFTGNRFEFRAVGSNQSIAGPMVAMNTIMAEALDEAATALEAADTSTQEKLGAAVAAYVKSVWQDCSNVVFNGDGYADEWQVEAAKRGLPNLVATPDALGVLKEQTYTDLFAKYGVLSERELDSRYEVYAEQYVASVNVESNLVVEMAKTMVFPAAVRYQGELASSLVDLKALGIEADHDTLIKVTGLIKKLQDSVAELEALKASEHDAESVAAHCFMIKDKVLPKMVEVRGYVDALETLVADDLWPLPTYQEMLFIR
ncbi:glutamine synthetase III [Labrenzia sp. 011]|uniref:glutamine synthetase III family protein n=1 Tax=Labrenzia sp. 011 TaxID=2171494 RepID=UPI000D514476|nr:glutamine synthetase III [Labrenzia sp. 011]PVB60770.1 glutamine synthetase type III [Labrenzia sp. 011]